MRTSFADLITSTCVMAFDLLDISKLNVKHLQVVILYSTLKPLNQQEYYLKKNNNKTDLQRYFQWMASFSYRFQSIYVFLRFLCRK